jgi:hypothetical protein
MTSDTVDAQLQQKTLAIAVADGFRAKEYPSIEGIIP